MTPSASRALSSSGAAAFVVVVALLAWYALTYLLLVFFGALLALLLRAPANWLAARTPLSPGAALAVVALLLAALLATGGFFFGKAVTEQTIELSVRLPQVIESLMERVREHPWGRRLIGAVTEGGKQASGTQAVGGALKAAGSTLEVFANIAIVVFFTMFLAAQPGVYVRGALHLVPLRGRERAREVLYAIGEVLERWLVGQAVLMACVALLSGIGLVLLGAPLALPLALLAGLLNFIPYVGPFLSAVPAILLGFSESPQLAFYIALLFMGVQAVEGYLLEPLIQHRAVYLPPALILLSQVVLGLVAGPLGLIVATPLTAAAVVAVKMLYIEDELGDRPG
jgi:predicted PurR-regulated permease PerM